MKSSILDHRGQAFPAAPQRALAEFYRAAGSDSRGLANWYPPNVSADYALTFDRNIIAARVHDLARNDGWASGALQKHVDAVIGAQWRLMAKPDYRALGLTPEWAREFATRVEARFRMWAEDPLRYCDAARQTNFTGLVGLLYRHFIADGECLAIARWLPGRAATYATSIQAIAPSRISNPMGKINNPSLRDGVARDPSTGAATGYWIRRSHQFDGALGDYMGEMSWDFFARETEWGRPKTIHHFEARQAGQTRGESWLAPILEKFRNVQIYDRTELQAAIVNALFAAWITSPFDHQELADGLNTDMSSYSAERVAFHEKSDLKFGDGRMGLLYQGEQVQMPNKPHPNVVFPAYMETALRSIATATGQSYEQVAMDWSKTNYSSARAALSEVWKHYVARRGHFTAGVVQPLYLAWLEEEIDREPGLIPAGAPGFYEARAAYARARWIGPARGYIDPTKEIDAANARMESFISTLEDEAADQGGDWEERLEQAAHEADRMDELGLVRVEKGRATVVPATQAEESEQARQNDARPASSQPISPNGAASGFAPRVTRTGALVRVAQRARSAEHEAALDARP